MSKKAFIYGLLTGIATGLAVATLTPVAWDLSKEWRRLLFYRLGA